MNIRILLLLSMMAALAASCAPGGRDDRELAALASGYAAGGDEGPGFDALSASTNHAGADAVPAPSLDPLAGAAFVGPPRIGNYGTVSLSYPVEVPDGRAGMQPAVALSYSSSGGDGIAGIGWVLSAGPGAISRDTTRGELRYDYRDTFTFNGRRLLKTGGPAESEDGTYRLEIESGFSRFELSGAARGGVWRVLDTNGVVTLYGADAESRIARPDDASRVFLWSFSRSTDLNGNYMTASYEQDGRVPYLYEVRYTGNEGAGLAARQWVRFSYKKRDDAYVSKAAGFTVRMGRLLDAVSVGWDGSEAGERELWRYECVYRISADSARPLLETVRSTRHSTMPKFSYDDAEHYFLWRGTANPYAVDAAGRPDEARYFEGDFNGDGISDMVFFDPGTGDWKAAEAVPGGGYVSALYGNRFRGEELLFLPGGSTGDYNGDGRSDIAFYLPRTREMWAAEHNGRTFDFRRYGATGLSMDLFACEWFSGDFDGNGLSDAVLFHEPTGRWVLMRNGGGYFDFLPIGRNFRNLFRDDYDPDAYLNGGGTSDTSARGLDRERVRFFSGDFNGDGRTDISVYDSRTGKWWVGESGMCSGEPGFRFSWIRYGSFNAPEQALFAHDRFCGDFNGDGLTDVLLFDREEGRWWLGRTGDRSISFSVYSEAPRFREITRWLQGDFNGDGRTDIGFYSSTDGRFWIGEASPAGFRYRAYTSLRGCPDPERILAAPLPAEEVVVSEARAVVTGLSGSAAVRYDFNGNAHRGKGEQAWAGHFSGGAGIELLVYKRDEGGFYLKNAGGFSPVLDSPGFGAEGSRVLEGGRPRPYRGGDGLLYYRPEESVFGGKRHVFSLVRYSGAGFVDEPVAEFGREEVESFDIGTSRYWIDRFEPDDTDNYLLVLDDRRDVPGFVLFGRGGAARRVSLAPGALDAAYFNDLRNKSVRIMCGPFAEDGRAGLLLVDTSRDTHCWYLGLIAREGNTVTFTQLSGNPRFLTEGFAGFRVSGESGAQELVYVTAAEQGPVTIHRLRIGSCGISAPEDHVLPGGTDFRGDFDYHGAPVVYEGGAAQRVVIGTSGCRLEPLAAEERIERPDLYERVYPFAWLQGDYNGDGKTDLGFFQAREREWYFALTQGAVPDLLTNAANGIGGSYEMEYENSSGFDNTGGDGVPDLPVNYRVCVKLTARDGLGGSVVTRYRYRYGCAFSAFTGGVKETDYFGFGEFTALDAYGAAEVSRYNAMPYDDFRKNRALAGAVKETIRKGSDGAVYARTEYDYEVKDLTPRPPLPTGEGENSVSSFLVVPSTVRTYTMGVLTGTRQSSVELAPGRYEIMSRTESVTDHYEDRVHEPVTVKTSLYYESDSGTNETRLMVKKSFDGSAHETTTRFEYNPSGNLVRERTSYTGTGLAAAADRIMEYGYDKCGNIVLEKDASGSPERVVEKAYDSELGQFLVEEKVAGDRLDLVTSCERDFGAAFGAVVKKTGPGGSSRYYEYDGLGRLARERADFDSGTETTAVYEYSETFPLSGKAVIRTGSGGDIGTRVFIDGLGRTVHSVRSASEEEGRRYVKSGPVAYDRAGRVIRRSRPSFAEDAEIDEFAAGWREKDPTVTEYDASGRVARVTLPQTADGGAGASISYTYEGAWQVTETHSVGRSKRTVRNARGLVLYVEEYGSGDDGAPVSAMIGFAYDAAGNRVKKMDTSPPGISPSSPPSPGGGAGEMDPVIPDELFHPGAKDRSGANIACWRYDGFGRVKEESDPDRGYASYEYDGFGSVVGKTDALGWAVSFTYDRLGRLTEKLLPGDEGRVKYSYDRWRGSQNAAGRLVRVDDPVQETLLSYDRAGRVKEESRRLKAALPSEVLQSVTGYGYDLTGRRTMIRYPSPSQLDRGLAVSYRYNAMGVISVEADDGGAVRPVVRSIAYDESGRMTEVRRGNGSVSAYEYDARGRLSRLVTTAEHNGQAWKVQDVTYSFRADDSIAAVENRPDVSAEGACESVIRYDYRYDGLNRLVRAEGRYERTMLAPGETSSPITGLPTGETSPPSPPLPMGEGGIRKSFELAYRYAPNGNMTGKTVYDPDTGAVEDEWSCAYEGHAATDIDTARAGARFRMRYDASGNMILQRDGAKGRAKEMAYDSANRVRRIVDPDSGEVMGRYDYDDAGARVRKVSRQVVDGEERYVETLSASIYLTLERQKTIDGLPIRGTRCAVSHIYLNGVRVAALASSGEAYYYLTDQVDSVQVTLDEAGKIVAQREYLPYGEEWVAGGEERNAPKYNSQELDKESGYYFYNARHYDPEVARFVTADSVVDGKYSVIGWNRYAYCGNNPVIYKDPSGYTVAIGGGNPYLLPDSSDVFGSKSGGLNSNNPNRSVGIKASLDDVGKSVVENTLQKANDKTVVSSARVETIGIENLKTINEHIIPFRSNDYDENDKIKITSKFGNRTDPTNVTKTEFHPGIDLKAPEGMKIYATRDGNVWVAGIGPTGINKDYGRRIYLNHENNEQSLYGHLSKVYVYPGQYVKAGQLIAEVGNTGKSTGSHLHYELRIDGKPFDPIFKME